MSESGEARRWTLNLCGCGAFSPNPSFEANKHCREPHSRPDGFHDAELVEVIEAAPVEAELERLRRELERFKRHGITAITEAGLDHYGLRLDELGIPRESYEGQAGGIAQWTFWGRVDELLRRFDADKAELSKKANARSAMADEFYRRAETAEAKVEALREALDLAAEAIRYFREPHHLDHAEECTACPVAAEQLDLALRKAAAALSYTAEGQEGTGEAKLTGNAEDEPNKSTSEDDRLRSAPPISERDAKEAEIRRIYAQQALDRLNELDVERDLRTWSEHDRAVVFRSLEVAAGEDQWKKVWGDG